MDNKYPLKKDLKEHVPTYYEKLGRASDLILRCADCRRLVTHEELAERGTCSCGTRRMTEVRALGFWEWLKIRTGYIDFQYRQEFLEEFSPWK